ncbi:MAG: DUF3841 domain-containing protein [Chitinophagales bacterium]|nr:DUF3841 domain-containing protein [Chitinophagales bacterium]
MKLWTYQSLNAVEQLEQSGELLTPWSYYPPKDSFALAYRWIGQNMIDKGVNCKGYAPIWAWHSCGAYKAPPTNDTASNLLSILQLEAGIKLITFECPDELAVLSNYGPWNEILDCFIDHGEQATIDSIQEGQLFKIRTNIEDYESIQACLPYLLIDWVTDIKKLDASEIL